MLPLIVACFWIGLYPKPLFEVLERPVNYVVSRVDKEYAEELRAAGTLPTLEAELASQASAASADSSGADASGADAGGPGGGGK